MDPDDGPTPAPTTAPPTVPAPVRLTPWRSGRPWGGGRYGSVDGQPVGELWVSGDEATLPDGRTLADAGIASSLPLVKILDIRGRLSVQVHPDDDTARALHGPAAVGKHECWVVLEAPAGATIALGLVPGAAVEDLLGGDEGRIVGVLRMRAVVPGSVLDIPPGTVHAPADGLVLYEIQQRSDLTYRIWDWGRPRPLHPAEARRAIRAASEPRDATLPGGPGCCVVSDPAAPFRLVCCRSDEAAGSAGIETDRPGVLSLLEGPLGLAGVDADGPTELALEPGSHWLVPAGRWTLHGTGLAFIATSRAGPPSWQARRSSRAG